MPKAANKTTTRRKAKKVNDPLPGLYLEYMLLRAKESDAEERLVATFQALPDGLKNGCIHGQLVRDLLKSEWWKAEREAQRLRTQADALLRRIIHMHPVSIAGLVVKLKINKDLNGDVDAVPQPRDHLGVDELIAEVALEDAERLMDAQHGCILIRPSSPKAIAAAIERVRNGG